MRSLPITNDIEQMAGLEPFVTEITEIFNLPEDFSFSLSLALDETVANVIMYAYPGQTGMPVHIEADGVPGKKLIIRIIDEGVPFDPTKEAPEVDTTLDTEDREIGGLGLLLVRECMDEVLYERKNDSNILSLIKYF